MKNIFIAIIAFISPCNSSSMQNIEEIYGTYVTKEDSIKHCIFLGINTYDYYMIKYNNDSIHLNSGKWIMISNEICLYGFDFYGKQRDSNYCDGFRYLKPVFGKPSLTKEFDVKFYKK